MSLRRDPHVLLLGWELPPRISGGLGPACQGLAEGLAAAGARVHLVVPRRFGGEAVAGARLSAAGDVPLLPEEDGAPTLGDRLQLRYLDSPLQPYETRAAYARRLRAARPDPPHPDARAAPFEGGYGPNLAREVERYARAVAELARREEVDVVHAHDWMTFPAGLLARRVTGAPLVVHVHSCEHDRAGPDADPAIRAVEQAGLDAADRVVCVSHYTAGVLAANYRVDPDRLRVVHNACTRREARRVQRVEANGVQRVLFLGRLTRQKGPEFFLRAAARVAERSPSARFVVAGDGDLREDLVERAAALGLARRVFFTGFLGPAEVERAYAEADVYVMPSASEPFGLTPLEALSLDVPVVVSRRSGVAEALPSAPRVDYGDVEDLAAKVLALLERPALRRALVRAGQADVARLRWETAGERLLDVFAEACA